MSTASGPLSGITVIEIATMVAAPTSGMMLADFGATVIKVEPPEGDHSRHAGWFYKGESLWWPLLGRNKAAVTLNLKHPEGPELLLKMVEKADVLIENMRPGKLEALGLTPSVLFRRNQGLVLLRVTGWGQNGPYKDRPSFGTQAEAMSGFAYSNGQPGGPPTLPSFPLADGVAGYLGAFSIMAALWRRQQDPERRGQVIDLSLVEAIFGLFGPVASAYDKLGMIQECIGSRSPMGAPRNIYRSADGRWLAISCAAQQIALRAFAAIGRPELIDDPRYNTVDARLKNVDEVDAIVQDWIGRHTAEKVVERFTEVGATVAPVYSIADVCNDEHFKVRQMLTEAESGRMGPIRMQNVCPRLSDTPGSVRWAGRELGEDNESWYVETLGLSRDKFNCLRKEGAI
jgi:crotonobetainyl-CoA:carnitine CoA-transferase CaiB-like acyl-CoA transferase